MHNLWIIGKIRRFMDKIQFQTKNFSEFCEDPRGAHQFFFQICGLFYNLWIMV